MTTPTPDGGGYRSISGSFDLLITSVDALETTMRGLRQDLDVARQAQARFTPGAGPGATAPGAQGAGSYNPGAGRTTLGNVLRGVLASATGTQGGGQEGQGAQAGGQGQPHSGQQPAASNSTQAQPGTPPPAVPSPRTPPPSLGQRVLGGAGMTPPGGSGGGRGAHGQPGSPGMGSGGSGGGWTNALLGGMRQLPYVGTAMAGVAGIQQLYLSEREKNRFYQGMEGGSNFDAFGERMTEEGYRWTMPGMSGDMARRSFKGVTSLGYNGRSQFRQGQGRQDALNFVYHNYNARGMDVEESLGLLQSASRDATVSFSGLSEALKDVSDTAGKAGVNAKLMRQNFQALLESSINTGAGPGAASLASIFTTTQASYGREFQGVDFSGQLSRGYQYMLGAQYGISPGQLQGIMRNQPQEYARMVTGSQLNTIRMFLSPQQIQEIQGLIKKYGSSQTAVPQIEQQFLNNHPEIDLNVLADALSGQLTGVQLDNSNVMDWIVQQLAGNTAAAHAQDQANPVKPMSTKQADKAHRSKFGLAEGEGTDWKDKLDDKAGTRPWTFGLWDYESKAAEVYKDAVKKTGNRRDPVLEALLQNVEDPNNTKVQVSTAQGEKVVSLADAMRHFPNELAAGNVKIVTGDQAGQSISEILEGNVDTGRDTKNELTKDVSKLGIKSESPDKYADAVCKNDTVGQKVTVDLSTEAKRLLQLLPSTDNQAQSTGYPPLNPNADQGSRGGN